MKKSIYKLFLLGSLILLFACNEKEFLEELPKDDIYAENLFVDYNGFKNVLNSLQCMVAQERGDLGGSFELSLPMKIGVDNGWANYTFNLLDGFNAYGVSLNSGYAPLETIFNWLYRAVNTSNMIISRADNPQVDWKGQTSELREANKNLILAQAKLIRAWAYRHLIYCFGPVPLSLVEINGQTYRNDWERTPVAEIQAQMEQDLLFAEQYLPESYSNISIPPKAVAQHYLAELYLFMNDPVNAEIKAQAVADNPNFSLDTVRYGVKAASPGVAFMDQFYDGNVLPSEGNKEVLWLIINEPDVIGAPVNIMRRTWVNRYYNFATVTAEYGGRGIGRASFTRWAHNLYEPTDDRFSQYAISKSYIKTSDGSTVLTKVKAEVKNDQLWPSTKKWDWTHPDVTRVADDAQFGDQPYLRLADTYLLLAEAQMKNGHPELAVKWINMIRRRSHATEITAASVTLDYILDERSRELLTEELRRYTLQRTGTLISRTLLHNSVSAAIQSKHALWPIPQTIIDANTGKPMGQNEGYN